jgi:RNA polymerase sigma-70 factor (ECF subfamily)
MTTETRMKFEHETLPYLDNLWRTAVWLTANERDAQGLVEDAFVEFSREWNEFIQGENARVWLFRKLTELIVQKNKLRFLFPVPLGIHDHYKPGPSINISGIKEVPAEIISEIIRSLPMGNRLVVVLSMFERFTYRQIAEIVGISEKNVSRKIYQAYMIIHKALIGYFATGQVNLTLALAVN